MYLNFYDLKLKPFEISPDPKFLWLGEKHKEAFAALKYGILENKGFMALTGDVGTGKTTIVNALANSVGDNIIFAQISDPFLETPDFFNITADVLEMNKKFSSKADFLGHLSRFLNDAYATNKEVVLIVEEAQILDQDLIEQIRLFSNIERPDKKLITIIFVGQNEFHDKLRKNRALRQRISIIYNIKQLTVVETEKYITHRLKVAGSEKSIFSPDAIREIYSFSQGNPRLINIICDLALLTGYVSELKIIDPETIRKCAENFQMPNQAAPDVIDEPKTLPNTIPEDMVPKERLKRPKSKIAYLAPAALIILACLVGYFYFFGDFNASLADVKSLLAKTIGRFEGLKPATSTPKPPDSPKPPAGSPEPPRAAREIPADDLKKRTEELGITHEELKRTKARAAALQLKVTEGEQALTQLKKKMDGLEESLNREKNSNKSLQAELSSKTASVAELQEKLDATASNAEKSENKIDDGQKEIARLQGRISDLEVQKASAESEILELKSEHDKLQTELAELKRLKARVSELDHTMVQRDQLLKAAEQKLAELAKKLEQEKNSKEQIQAELASKAAMASALQEKIEVFKINALEYEGKIEQSAAEIADLQEQLTNSQAQTAAAITKLDQVTTGNRKLVTELKELQGTKERVAELENTVAQRKQLLYDSEQKVIELTKQLEQEKKTKDTLQAELLSKVGILAKLQKQLAASDSSGVQMESEMKNSQKEVMDLQSQLVTLKIHKTAADTQLSELKSRLAELQNTSNALKSSDQRSAELEAAVAQREQMLSQSRQKLALLSDEYSQVKERKDLLQDELAAKDALVAELQNRLQTLQAQASMSESELENRAAKTAELQEQLNALKARESTEKIGLDQLKARNQELNAELQKLQATRERLAELERTISQREQLHHESEQKLAGLAKELELEKKNKDLLQAELSSKIAVEKQLQEKLKSSESAARELEVEIKRSKQEINTLQGKLTDLEAQKIASQSAAAAVEAKDKPTAPTSDEPEAETEPPPPTDIIDWIIKKKSESSQ